MPESLLNSPPHPSPTPSRPLLGVTVLVVEDSRFACEALRLLCLRSGARVRRADCLKSARRHLRVYRPSVIIVDLGLPDGSGLDLIRELVGATPRVPVILGTSGDRFAEHAALDAGADGYLPKPIESLAIFQEAILSRMPADRRPATLSLPTDELIRPDPIAYQDDMAHAADVLSDMADAKALDYVAQFIGGVARSAADEPLARAAEDLADARRNGRPVAFFAAQVAGLVQTRLNDRRVV
ncbi:response regulator [Marinibacterium profundimaris]|uniref:Response regulator n=1 Tax=Marinibacterium profundimaris TaxID=1679460 RepID=A0A225NC42_9RHOB|nr:response regulator [Marinibacterium profundimaris]OWU67862.1 response regulator [Marinibacterium profundimaris]